MCTADTDMVEKVNKPAQKDSETHVSKGRPSSALKTTKSPVDIVQLFFFLRLTVLQLRVTKKMPLGEELNTFRDSLR